MKIRSRSAQIPHSWVGCAGPVIAQAPEFNDLCAQVWEAMGPLDRLNFHKAICLGVENHSTAVTLGILTYDLTSRGVPA